MRIENSEFTNKNNIVCDVECETLPNGDVNRIFELTIEGRVWPCCHYATDAEYPQLEGMDISDPVLEQLKKDDPEWNNAEKHGLDTVMKHDVFWTHLWDEGFDSDNPPSLCVLACQRKKPDHQDSE